MRQVVLPEDLARRRVLQTREARAYCGLTPQTWRRLRAERKLPAPILLTDRTHGYRVSDLDLWLESRREKRTALDAA
jgi:predicted DNA-binding transcriptional regulator AlpA